MHTKHARDCSVAYIIPLNAGSALFKACLQLITLKTRSKSTQNFARFIHRNMNTFEKTFTYLVWHQKERTNETDFNHFVYNCIYAVNMYKGIYGKLKKLNIHKLWLNWFSLVVYIKVAGKWFLLVIVFIHGNHIWIDLYSINIQLSKLNIV